MEIPNAFYNLDLTPSDFRLFLIVIDYLNGKKFESEEELQLYMF